MKNVMRWVMDFLSKLVMVAFLLVPGAALADDGGGILDGGRVQDAGTLGPNGFKVDEDIDPLNLLDLAEKAVTTRNYSMGAGVMLLVVVYMVRKRWSEIPPDLVPAVGLAIASLPALALVLMRPQVNQAMVFKQVIMITLMAGGAWSAIGKRIFTVWAPRVMAMLRPAPVPVVVPPPVSEVKNDPKP